jgi:murein biosynthesis integral membrane protein MurJ
VSPHGRDRQASDPRPYDPRYRDPRAYDPRPYDPRAYDPRAYDPRYADPRHADPRHADPRAYDPRHADPRHADPRHRDPRPYDPRAYDPRYRDPRYADPRYADPRYRDPRAYDPRPYDPRAYDPRYRDPRYADPRYRDPRAYDPRPYDPRYRDPRYRDPRAYDPRPYDPRYADPRYRAGGPATLADVTLAERTRAGTEGLVRATGTMAAGTLASRVTGLLRTFVLIYALGTATLGNVYNYSNTIPNAVYNIAIGGVLTSVIVPLLVKAAKRNRDRGEAYDQRMFTLVTVLLAAITVIATLAAAQLALLYDPSAQGASRHLLVIWAFFFMPQIFFYGVSSLAGAILNARGHFASPMWTPVVNNIVVIVITAAFIGIAGVHRTPATITPLQVQLLGFGTTLGIVAQTVALIPSLRRVGFRWHPRFDFRRAEVGEISRMAGWMLGYVATTQVAFLVTSRVASSAERGPNAAHGFAAYSNAWLLFQLPYAIVGISVITALLPRMSAHAAERRYSLVRSDFSTGVRLASVIVVPAALVLAVLGQPLADGLLAWGHTSYADARYMGEVFAVFSLGLVPYMLFQLLLRVFYALHDSRTAAMIGVLTMFTNIAANLIALSVLPARDVVVGLGAGFGLANLAGTIAAWRILGRRIGGLAGHVIGPSLVRMHMASIPAALFALGVAVMIGSVLHPGRISALATVVVGGSGALLVYLVFARGLRIREVSELAWSLTTRLRR